VRSRGLSGLRLYTLAPYSPTLREGVTLEEEKPADLAPRARSSPEETPVGAPDEHLEAHLLLGLLTPREAEVLRLMVRGHTNREMAQELSIALSTVKNHVHTIIASLRSRTVPRQPYAPSNSACSRRNRGRKGEPSSNRSPQR
jgi:DNA-binding CsgD family transcriptional regulator